MASQAPRTEGQWQGSAENRDRDTRKAGTMLICQEAKAKANEEKRARKDLEGEVSSIVRGS